MSRRTLGVGLLARGGGADAELAGDYRHNTGGSGVGRQSFGIIISDIEASLERPDYGSLLSSSVLDVT